MSCTVTITWPLPADVEEVFIHDDLKKDEQKKVETQRQAKAERKVCLDRGFANPVSSVVVFASLNTFKSSSRKRSSESTSKIASGSGS